MPAKLNICAFTGEITATEYKDIRSSLGPELEKLGRQKVAMLNSDEDYQSYLDKGIPKLKNIDKLWLSAGLEEKRQIVGSISPQKLIFEKNNYRTITTNPLMKLIADPNKGSSRSKKKKAGENSGQFCSVRLTEPLSNQMMEIAKALYYLTC